jgi:beta-phosphoglucomutase-like phosphatase (HAD superfamily)
MPKNRAAVIELIRQKGVAKEGVGETIALCQAAGLPMAVASSSSVPLIQTVLEKLGIRDNIKIIHSAHDETHGKPHPAVYISTAKTLGVEPSHCLAFEDSVNGVLAAKSAKMKCIAVPEPDSINNKSFGCADIILTSLHDFNAEILQNF